MATIEVDGRTLEVEDGIMLIQATDAAGIHIPRFCYHEKLSIAANCRMCLVEVEKAPKPLPACATPVMDGMKVFTRSEQARDAQKGTLEFLLINHPLDCPVCDQGGECPLQDQALAYGKGGSRFSEAKRAVPSGDIGPLIQTYMTRCIHCTRCVRFGEEIAGVMELGMAGRGEHSRIGPFLDRTVDSELSGNMIDLCPVGALTSKPFKFAARSWELQDHPGISPHDCVGANLDVQTLRGEVLRVLPRDNPEVNDCWLADRDRYSYQAVSSAERLLQPMIRDQGGWRETDWATALSHAAAGLKTVIEAHGAEQVGALASPTATLEEFYLLQKLVRGLGSSSVDHRLRQVDFRDDDIAPPFPGSELSIWDYDGVSAALLVGSNIRKEQPLLGLRLRQAAVRNGARMLALNSVDYGFHFPLAAEQVVSPAELPSRLAALAAAVAQRANAELPEGIAVWAGEARPEDDAMAEALLEEEGKRLVVLGAAAQQHPDAAPLRAMAAWLCETVHARLAVLPEGNGAAAWLAGCVPHRGPAGEAVQQPGRNAAEMLADSLRACLLLGTEPELDAVDGARALAAMEEADFVVQLAVFRNENALDYADVLLPMASFAEGAGTWVNCEGRVQESQGAAPPLGESRPGWKILRALGSYLQLEGFGQNTLEEVRAECEPHGTGDVWQRLAEWRIDAPSAADDGEGLQRIADTPLYRVDPLVRRAPALQATRDNPPPALRVNGTTLEALGLEEGGSARVSGPAGEATLPVVLDERVPDGCALVAAGHEETLALGGQGMLQVEGA